MALAPAPERFAHASSCVWFWLWVLVGTGAAFSFLSFLGLFLVLPTAGVALLLASKPNARRGAVGLLTGVGLVLLLIAYLNRHGPGMTCVHTTTSTRCDEHHDPIAWLVPGALFAASGVLLQWSRWRPHRS